MTSGFWNLKGSSLSVAKTLRSNCAKFACLWQYMIDYLFKMSILVDTLVVNNDMLSYSTKSLIWHDIVGHENIKP